MYTLEQLSYVVEKASVVAAVTMLCWIALLYIRVKYYNTGYGKNKDIIAKVIRYAEHNTTVLVVLFAFYLALQGVVKCSS